MSERIQKLAEDLIGTAQDIGDVCQQHGFAEADLTDAERADLNDQVICCEQCGWWDEAGVFDENQICDDCKEGNADE